MWGFGTGIGGRRRGEGGQIWKGFYGLDFSVKNPNRTPKAKPVTVLKGRERKGRKIPIKEAGDHRALKAPCKCNSAVYGEARLLPESSKPCGRCPRNTISIVRKITHRA